MTLESKVAEAEAGPDPKRFRALFFLALAQLMVVLDASVVIVALPSAQRALHISVADRQWVVTAYTLAFGSLLLLGGRIADYMGRRRMFIVGLIGFAAASALGGLAQDSAMLFGARALQGAFAAIMAPAALSLLTTTFVEPKERARAFGVYGGIAGGGAAIGLILGGTLTQLASWRWTLLINVPIALLAVVGAISRPAREQGRPRPLRHHRHRGCHRRAVHVGLRLHHGRHPRLERAAHGLPARRRGDPPRRLRGPGTATRHPLLPLRVVLDRNRGGSYLAALLVGSAMLGTFLFLTYFFQGTLGYSALRTGFAFLPFSGGIIVGATIASRFLPRVGPRALMVTGLIMGMGGLIWFTQLTPASSYLADVVGAEILTSLGMGMAFVPMSSSALIGVDPSDAGVASALVNTTQQVGSSLGTALLNTLAATATATYLAAHFGTSGAARAAAVHGYTTGFTLSAVLLGLAALSTAILVRPTRSEVEPVPEGAALIEVEALPVDLSALEPEVA